MFAVQGPDPTLVAQYGPLVAYGVLFLAGLAGLLKVLAPKAFDALLERLRFRADAERQDDIALWQSMVRLQTQTLNQNQQLVDFIISLVEGDLRDIAVAIRQGLGELQARWLDVIGDLTAIRSEQQAIRTELSRLADRQARYEERLASMMAFVEASRGQ